MFIRAFTAVLLWSTAVFAQGLAIQPTRVVDFIHNQLASDITFTRTGSNANYWGPDGLVHSAAAGVPRFDWSCTLPTIPTLACGILSQPASTNLITASDDLTGWTLSTGGIAAKNATGLRGDANGATTLTATNANDSACFALVNASATRAGSVYLKRKTGTGAVNFSIDNLSTSVDFSGVLVTNGWYRATKVQTALTNATLCIQLATAGDSVIIGGAQVEAQSVVTSIMFTSGATASRNAELVTMTATAFGWNCGAGTMVGYAYAPPSGPSGLTGGLVNSRDVSTNRLQLVWVTTAAGSLGNTQGLTGGSFTFNPNQQTWPLSGFLSLGVSYGANWRGYGTAGILRSSTASPTNYTNNCTQASVDFGSIGTGSFTSAPVARVLYYNTQLADGMLQGLVGINTTWWVSNAVANGIPVGSDSNTGRSKTAPFLTLDKALSSAVTGDTIMVNDGTYTAAASPNGYFNVAVGVDIEPVTAYGATLKAQLSQARVVYVTPFLGERVTIGKFVVDGQSDTLRCIERAATINPSVLAINNTRCRNSAQDGVYGNNINGQLYITGWDYIGTRYGVLAVFDDNISTLVYDGTGGTLQTTQTTSGEAAIWVLGGLNNVIKNTTVTANVGAGGTSGIYTGFLVQNTLNPLVTNNTISMTTADSSPAVQPCRPIWIETTPGSVNTTFLVTTPAVSHNTITHDCTGGHGITVGEDAALDPTRAPIINPTVTQNTLTMSARSQAGFAHGMVAGAQVQGGGLYSRNKITGAWLAYLSKEATGGVVFESNLAIDTSGAIWGDNNSTGTQWWNNTSYASSTFNPIGWDYVSETDIHQPPPSGGVFVNNIDYRADASLVPTFVQIGQGADGSTFSRIGNNDYISVATPGTNSWCNLATCYTTLAAWKAAVEPTAVSLDPSFISAPTDLSIPHGSAVATAGATTIAPVDYAGTSFANPPSIGAYQAP